MSISGFRSLMSDSEPFAAVLVRSSASLDFTCQGHVCFLFHCHVSQIWELLMATISLSAALNVRPFRDTAVAGSCVTRLTDVPNDLKTQPVITSGQNGSYLQWYHSLYRLSLWQYIFQWTVGTRHTLLPENSVPWCIWLLQVYLISIQPVSDYWSKLTGFAIVGHLPHTTSTQMYNNN